MAGDRRELRPETMARPGGHDSHAVVGAGLVFVAGQLPIAPDGSRLNEASFDAQATLADAVAWGGCQGPGADKVLRYRALMRRRPPEHRHYNIKALRCYSC